MSADKRLALLAQANKFFRQGKIDSAIRQYEKILEIRPEDLEIRRIIGDLQLKENREAEAVRQFEWIADYYLKEGFFTKAIAMYKTKGKTIM
jgi:tetratricopeptide (TPR) repeat protein